MNKLTVIIFFLGVFMLSACSDNEIVLIADPRVLAMPVIENHEPWVDLRTQSVIKIGPSPEIDNNQDYFYMRKTVYEKLVAAQALLPDDLQFCLYEAYRSLALQNQLFTTHYNDLKKIHPTWSHDALFIETTKLVSPVTNLDDTKNIPPHSTGAAIDVYLLDKNGQVVDMGMHPKDWMLDHDGSLSLTDSKIISKEAQKYRHMMSKVLTQVGFANYPTEYWHWSYGDRYWAYQKGQSHAIYGNNVLPNH
ncbi:MAG: M15 family metallopeptidase [Gammaproteobacteria bacterium]|jgi:D-alanyl-D-alanine dipeptidase